MTHTPTPWKQGEEQKHLGWSVESHSDYVRLDTASIAIGNEKGVLALVVWDGRACTFQEFESNAEFIVKVVNAHDELISLIKMALPAIDYRSGQSGLDGWTALGKKVRATLSQLHEPSEAYKSALKAVENIGVREVK